MIRAIAFDWGGVLIENPTKGLLKYCAKQLQMTEHSLSNAYRKYAESFQKGTISEQSLWEIISPEWKNHSPRIFSLWEKAFKNVYQENKEVFQFVSLLKQNGYLTGFLSNTEYPAMRFFQKQHYDMFDVTVFSCAEGTRKPEKKIYQILLTKLRVEPQETVFVDDRSEFIDGAETIGIHGILFQDLDQLRRDLSSLSVKVT
ncbi:Haloacid dehalogenase-like hydrolase [uncultured archaeon]|nr:Haloacid dehalogenase-like hydrolase [uncultured archaeon]